MAALKKVSARLSPAIETLMTRVMQQLRRFDDRVFRISIILATIASFVVSIIRILREPDQYQWDFKVYYNSPLLLAQGQDPYEAYSVLKHLGAKGAFVFPPVYLQIFRAFSSLFTYDQCYWIFLFTKILCFATLLAIWKKFFLKTTQLYVFAVFVWLGFYATFLIDFQAGNVAVFETMILFLAFVCFLKDRLGWFVFLIVFAASIKLTPIFFLVLLLLAPNRYSVRYFALGCAGFLSYALLNLILFSDLTRQFISEAMKRINESGVINPSSHGFINQMLRTSLSPFNLIPSSMLVNVIYLAVGICIVWTSWRAWKLVKIVDEGNNFNRLFLILFSILVYTLIMPRMKDYAYMIAIPSVLFAIERFEILVPRWIVFLPLVLISSGDSRPPLFRIFADYYPLFVASFFWYLYLRGSKAICALTAPIQSPAERTEAPAADLRVSDDRALPVARDLEQGSLDPDVPCGHFVKKSWLLIRRITSTARLVTVQALLLSR